MNQKQRSYLPKSKRENDRPDAENIVCGRNPVMEALRGNRTIDKLMVAKGEKEGSLLRILADAKQRGIPVLETARAKLESLAGGAGHQGVVAFVTPFTYSTIEQMFQDAANRQEAPLLLVLDGVTDPHNLGAIIRTANAVGVHGILLPKRNACSLTATVLKAAAGACEYVRIARITNVTDAIEDLKRRNVWIYGADGESEQTLHQTDWTGPCAIVLGDEGKGISRLVLEHCDFRVRIPMKGQIGSLNVSVAGAVLLYEVLRQREVPR